MLNMLNMWNVFGEIGGVWKGKTFNIFNISPVLATFRKKTFNISPVSWKSHETGEMLNVFSKSG